MPIKIKCNKEGLSCVIVLCDFCGEKITNAKDGNYEWKRSQENEKVDIYFTHKKCAYPFEEANGGRFKWLANELSVFPIYLGNNLELDWEKAKETAWWFSAL